MWRRLCEQFLVAWRLPRWRWALLVAGVSDVLGFGMVFLPPVQWVLDVATALVLFAVLGFRWPLLIALGIEVVPMLELFPAWTLFVVAMASAEGGKKAMSDE
ncbi:MAG: hypothetical protein ACK5TP_11490 [bacterium]